MPNEQDILSKIFSDPSPTGSGIDPNAAIQQEQKKVLTAEAPLPNMRPNPENPLNKLGNGYAGTESPMMQLNAEDIFPGMQENIIPGYYSGKIVGSNPLYSFSAGGYFPYNIAQQRKRALNNAAILKVKQEKDARKQLEFDPNKTPSVYEEQYNNMFYDQVQNLYKEKVNKYNGNSVAAYNAMTDPTTQDYKDLHNRLNNLDAVANNLQYVYDFAQRVAGTKEASPLKKYYPQEAKQLAADILEGRASKDDWAKENWAKDKLSELRGYDNLVQALTSPQIAPLLQTNVDKLVRQSMAKDETGKFRINEKKLKEYKSEDETVKRIVSTMDNMGYTFNQKQIDKMPELIDNYMKARVKEADLEKYVGPVQAWTGKGFDEKKMYFNVVDPKGRFLRDGQYQTPTGKTVVYGVKGATGLPMNTFLDTEGKPTTGKPTGNLLNFGTNSNPKLYMQMQVPKPDVLNAILNAPDEQRQQIASEYFAHPENYTETVLPISDTEENKVKFSGEYSIQDIDSWYKSQVGAATTPTKTTTPSGKPKPKLDPFK